MSVFLFLLFFGASFFLFSSFIIFGTISNQLLLHPQESSCLTSEKHISTSQKTVLRNLTNFDRTLDLSHVCVRVTPARIPTFKVHVTILHKQIRPAITIIATMFTHVAKLEILYNFLSSAFLITEPIILRMMKAGIIHFVRKEGKILHGFIDICRGSDANHFPLALERYLSMMSPFACDPSLETRNGHNMHFIIALETRMLCMTPMLHFLHGATRENSPCVPQKIAKHVFHFCYFLVHPVFLFGFICPLMAPCCYMLTSGKHTYIGFTTDLNRRLRQHNGKISGGAKYTKKYRPWSFKCIVRGFKSSTEGLQFEWAWKHPSKSRVLKTVKGRGSKDRMVICRLLCSLKPHLSMTC